ncbi:MAG: glycosyltransferase, partial [Eubacterium sp.]|nr:glycosyltransferase [Eubacterium sp.]
MEKPIRKKEVTYRGNVLYMVVPCYNEEGVIEETTKRLSAKLKDMIARKKINDKSRIVYVNDGSKDGTWRLINKLYKEYDLVSAINLSRNRGHQNAVLAGLMYAKDRADIAISMDADLQDD